MGLFDKGLGNTTDAPQQQQRQQVQFPDLITYEVFTDQGKWEQVAGHNAQVVEGHLLIFRGVCIDEAYTQASAVPTGFFAPGKWTRCRTNYMGCPKPSDLAI